jgi:anti-sigma-K factor RskA
MPESLLTGYSALLYSGTTVAASANSSQFTLPVADSYTFILDVGTPGGTTETLDAAIQTSVDGGTTFYDWWRFTQATTAAITYTLTVQPVQGRGEAGSVATITAAGTGALNTNKPFANPCRLALTLGGTLPTYATIKLWVICQPRSQSW